MAPDIDFTPKTVCISGTYGSGKSQRVCDYLRGKDDQTLLFVCYRISQGLDFAGKLYHNQIPITCYVGHGNAYITNHRNRILISTQSISKICPLLQYDTVVVDEATSLLLDAATSSLVPKSNVEILFHVMAQCTKLIVMDVNLTPDTLGLVSTLRAHNGRVAVQRIPNIYKNSIVFEDSKAVFLAALLEDLNMGHNVVLCSDSRKQILDIASLVPPAVKKRVYTNGHPYAEDLQNVNDVWTKFQLVCFSPSITTATSFTLPHFHAVYGFFSFASLTARAFAQQLHRVRNVLNGKIYVHCTAPPKSYLRNLKKLHTVLDPIRGVLVQSHDPITQLVEAYNREVLATYRGFKGALIEAIYNNS